MKVFFVNTTKKWGGGEKWHLETACAMSNRGHEVAIMALPGKDLYKRSVSCGMRTITVHVSNLSFLNPFRLISIIKLLKKENPAILILNFSSDIKTVGVAAKFAGIRNIIYRRGSAIPIRNTLVNRLLYKKVVTHIIATSIETKRTILQNNSKLFPAGKITVLYNGIDLEQLDRMPDNKLYQRKKNEVLIGNVGRLVLIKGQKYLIEMALIIKKKGINFKVLIAGEGLQEASLKQMAVKAGVEDQLVFLGFINNIKAFMDNIDIFVLTSLSEGFGYVLVEAMACRKPVVAFNTSSMPEIIANNKTGFLVDNMDIDAFAQKVEYLIGNPILRESLGQSGRRRVEEIFDVTRTEDNLEQLLTNL